MTKLINVLVLMLISMPAYAAEELASRLTGYSFDAYHNIEKYSFTHYLSDYGMTLRTDPNGQRKRGDWSIKGNKLCFQWFRFKNECFNLKADDNKIRFFQLDDTNYTKPVITLSHPQKGNMLNKHAYIQANMNKIIGPDRNAANTYSLSVGLSHKFSHLAIIAPKNDTAKVIDDETFEPTLTFRSPYYYLFGKSRFGWYLESGYSSFDLHESCFTAYCDHYERSATGRYVYIVPMAFIALNNVWAKSERFGVWRFGLGLGLAYLEGDAYIDTDTQVSNYHVPMSTTGTLVNYVFDYRLHNFTFRVRRGQSLFEENGNSFDLEETAIELYLTLDI